MATAEAPLRRTPRLWIGSAQTGALLAALGVAGLILGVLLIVLHRDHLAEREEIARGVAQGQAAGAAAAINAILEQTQDSAKALAAGLNDGSITPAGVPDALNRMLAERPWQWGLGVAYDQRRQGSPPPALANSYYTRPGGQITPGAISYDYTDPLERRGHWWRRGYETETWVPPYLGGTSRRMVALYVSPFHGPTAPADGSPAGVILASLQLDNLNREVGWSDLGASGYGFLISRSGSYGEHPTQGRDGAYVAHPNKDYWRGTSALTVGDVARRTGHSELNHLLEPESSSEGGWFDYQDEVTGKDGWLFYEPIPKADWVLGFVVIKDVVLAGDDTAYHQQIWIGVALIAGVVGLVCAGMVLFLRGLRRLWCVVATISLGAVAGIVVIWGLTTSTAGTPAVDIDGASLLETVDDYRRYVDSVQAGLIPDTVMAGVFVDHVDLDQNRNYIISGTIWQRYLNGVPDGVSPGFLFPDAVEPPQFEEAYTASDGDIQTVGWSFSVAVDPSFKLARFPFDEAVLSLRMVHSQVDKPIVLLPDVGEYNLIVPTALPGLAPGVSVGGFAIDESYFKFQSQTSNTTFGIPDFTRQVGAPDITFNMRLSRGFLNPFISQMLPVIVVSVLVFAVHMTITEHGERRQRWGTTTASTLAFLGTLMFVTLVGHNGLRSNFGASSIIYLEYFYFIMYFAILAVALNTILFTSGAKGVIVDYKDNLLAKLVYWPLVTLTTFLVTLVVFY